MDLGRALNMVALQPSRMQPASTNKYSLD